MRLMQGSPALGTPAACDSRASGNAVPGLAGGGPAGRGARVRIFMAEMVMGVTLSFFHKDDNGIPWAHLRTRTDLAVG